MDLLVALLILASFVATALVIGMPPRPHGAATGGRRFAAIDVATALLAVAALAALAHGLLGPAERELVCRHTFVGYEGSELEPSAVHFPTETTHAPGWQWPLPFVGFAVLWIALLRVRHRLDNPFGLPIAFAWSAMAVWLLQQKLAAPAAVVQPVGLDRFLWPAGVALTLRISRSARSLVHTILHLSLGVEALRLPAALFSKVASDRGLGTALDVSGVVRIIHPLTRMEFEPALKPGSAEQQFWLIWAENLIVYPALHLLSFVGIAFAAFMLHKHSRLPD